MRGEFSWLVLVAVFLAIAGVCGLLITRLLRIGSAAGEPAAPEETPR
jgi:hypothetical protein